MSQLREPTEKEKRIINRLALRDYEMRQLRASSRIWTGEPLPEFRLPYPEAEIDREEKASDLPRKSAHDLLIESLGGKCQVCGSIIDLEAHHIISLEKGGPDVPSNLTVLCRECHTKTF